MLRMSVTMSSPVRLEDDLGQFLDRVGRRQVASAQQRILGTSSPPNAPLTVALKGGGDSRPLRDTGQLLSSINSRVDPDGRTVRIGTSRAGARINQEGGTITARKSWLFIPASRRIRNELRNNGSSVSRLIRSYKARGFRCFKKGNAFFAGNRQETVMLFILKKSVRIPSRPFLYISDEDRRKIMEDFDGIIKRDSGGNG